MNTPSEQELKEFRTEFSNWLEENKPEKPDFILPETFMEVGMDEQFHFLRDWQRKVYEAGYLGMAWPKEYGGGGVHQAFQDVVTSEMTRQQTPFMMNTIGLNWAGPLILHSGSEEQKKKHIQGILSTDDIWCQGFSEPNHGSDLGNAQTKAVRDGDDYVVNGSKIWTSIGAYAKYIILLARTKQDTPNKYDGLSFFLAPMDIPGVSVSPIKKLTGEHGFTQTFFDDAHIPASCMIGQEGEGWKMAMITLTFERGVTGGQAGGHSSMEVKASEVVDLARNVMREGRPALESEYVRDGLVQLLMDEHSMKLNRAQARIPALQSEWPNSIAMSGKLMGTEFRRRMGQFALSMQGANAAYYFGEQNVEGNGAWQRTYFNAFSGTIGGGTSQVQKNILGERVLGLPKS
ncbi:MAG: acyl-CoA dehydrogenase family protein [Pseudomonadota bacterium]